MNHRECLTILTAYKDNKPFCFKLKKNMKRKLGKSEITLRFYIYEGPHKKWNCPKHPRNKKKEDKKEEKKDSSVNNLFVGCIQDKNLNKQNDMMSYGWEILGLSAM